MKASNIVVLALVCGFASEARAEAKASDPVDFYRDLAGAVQSAKGRILFYIHAGHWKTSVGGTSVIWDIDEGTKITSQFEYASNHLAQASITFRPPVHVWLLGPKSVSGALSKVTYDSDGDVADWNIQQDGKQSLDASGQPRLQQQQLAFPTQPKDLFMGLPFKGAARSARCAERSKTDCAGAPMIYRVRIESTADQPGLSVDLKHDYVVNLSRPGKATGYANFVNVDTGTFMFDHVDLDLDERTIDGELVKFKVTALGAQLSSRDVDFSLRSGTSLAMSNIAFSLGRDRIGSIDAHGEIVGTLGAASELNITSGMVTPGGTSIASHVAFDSGSVHLVNVEITQLASGRSVIQVGTGSRVEASLLSSQLAIGSDGLFGVKSGIALFKLDAARWDSEGHPTVAGRLSLSNVVLGSSRFKLNSVSDVRVAGGTLVASDLAFSSVSSPMLTGKFNELVLLLEDHSHLGVPTGFVFETAPSASIRMSDINHPVEFVVGDDLPRGLVHLDLPFRSLRNAENATFALTGGSAQMDLLRRNDGSLLGSQAELNGLITLDGSDGNVANVRMGIAGTVEKAPGGLAKFVGTWSAVLPANSSWTFATPYEHGQASDERHYSIKLGLGLAAAVSLAAVPITFDGSRFSTAVERDVTLRVTLPGGSGEHKDPDHPENGYSSDQPDEAKGNQEVFTDTFLPPVSCRLHIYLKPHVYDLGAHVKLASSETAPLVLSLPSISVPTIEFDKDGCEGIEFFAVLALDFLKWIGKTPNNLQDGIDGLIQHLGQDVITRFASHVHIEIGKP